MVSEHYAQKLSGEAASVQGVSSSSSLRQTLLKTIYQILCLLILSLIIIIRTR
jgi:hypothetical protein